MAFNLKKVVRALLFSSSQPLAIKDIQDAVARFHEQKSAMAALLQEAARHIEGLRPDGDVRRSISRTSSR